MSLANKNTIFGKIQYQNKLYELIVNNLLNQQTKSLIEKFKQNQNCITSSAPWLHEDYHWVVENDKIYLTSIKLNLCNNTDNQIMKIFGQNKIFAYWVQKASLQINRVLLQREEINSYYQREILILDLQNGVLKDTNVSVENYRVKELKNYIAR